MVGLDEARSGCASEDTNGDSLNITPCFCSGPCRAGILPRVAFCHRHQSFLVGDESTINQEPRHH